jgi:hypothetical protein
MDKRTTANAFDDRSSMINRRSADLPGGMTGAALSPRKPLRIVTSGAIDARVAPEPPVPRTERLRATWRKADGGGLVCHWTRDQE